MSVCGSAEAVQATKEERTYSTEMRSPELWQQRELVWRTRPSKIVELAKALPLMSDAEAETFKVMVENLCELAGPDIWRQAIDNYQRSILWHAVDLEDSAAVECLLAFGAGEDERTRHSCAPSAPRFVRPSAIAPAWCRYRSRARAQHVRDRGAPRRAHHGGDLRQPGRRRERLLHERRRERRQL